MGVPNQKHAGTPAVVQKHYGHLRTAALSLAGNRPAASAWNELLLVLHSSHSLCVE